MILWEYRNSHGNFRWLYPLVNIQKTMENHHVQWENPLFLWPFSIAMLVYQRVEIGMLKQKLTTNDKRINKPDYDVPSKLSNQKPNFHLSKLSISKKPSISRRKLSFLNFHNFSAF